MGGFSMNSKHRIITVLLFIMIFAFAYTVTGDDKKDAKKDDVKKDVPESITLKAPEGVKKPRGDVEFTHKKHFDPKDEGGFGYACKKCHHKMKSDDETPQKCFECHKLKKEGDTPKFKDAYHDQCKDCHKKGDGKDKKNAPKKCKECHKKKKPAGEAK